MRVEQIGGTLASAAVGDRGRGLDAGDLAVVLDQPRSASTRPVVGTSSFTNGRWVLAIARWSAQLTAWASSPRRRPVAAVPRISY